MLRSNTPIERHPAGRQRIYVKREDMCCDGPAFSKLRGVAAHIHSRPENVIGVLDTFHSRAGWGVSALCPEAGRHAVVFYPVYKDDLTIRGNQLQAKKLGAQIHGITAGRSCILYHHAKARLAAEYPDSYMLPNALKCPETVEETAKEVHYTPGRLMGREFTWVVSVSSGTIAAGVLRGLVDAGAHCRMVLHLGYSRTESAVRDYVVNGAGGCGNVRVEVVDQGYEYKDACPFPAPFPCNVYYDRKAWRWVVENTNTDRILFWNIGA